jgi:hypothetical protein
MSVLLCGGTAASHHPVAEAAKPHLRQEGSFFQQVELNPVAAAKIAWIVLRAEFKPGSEPKDVYLLDRFVERAWLPVIENISFTMIDSAELKRRGKAYFFKQPVMEKGLVRVDFGFGDDCSGGGASYFFHVNGTSVHQDEHANGGWGSGCSSGSADAKKP